MTVRLGFYGAGFITNVHAWWLRNCGIEHVITAIHDPVVERAASFAERHGAEVVSEDELLEHVDAVYVTPWTSEHPRLVEKAAARGRGSRLEPCRQPWGGARSRQVDVTAALPRAQARRSCPPQLPAAAARRSCPPQLLACSPSVADRPPPPSTPEMPAPGANPCAHCEPALCRGAPSRASQHLASCAAGPARAEGASVQI